MTDKENALYEALMTARETLMNSSHALLCAEETLKRCEAGGLSPSVVAHALKFIRDGLQRTVGDIEEVVADSEE